MPRRRPRQNGSPPPVVPRPAYTCLLVERRRRPRARPDTTAVAGTQAGSILQPPCASSPLAPAFAQQTLWRGGFSGHRRVDALIGGVFPASCLCCPDLAPWTSAGLMTPAGRRATHETSLWRTPP
ncbi:hypothetical protein BD309DRAFT_115175 [Dichomitus squalens]|nr:hypothetical protein BD309DRAFT_115175 [Dichomitus squalens]